MLLTIAYYQYIFDLYSSKAHTTAWDHHITRTRAHLIDSSYVPKKHCHDQHEIKILSNI